MEMQHNQVSYGAVYFRKSNPPRQDWERDYAQASKDGMNIFRHWFMWGSIEIAPGIYDWADYDMQLDLAAKYGIRTIIAEMVTSAPEWLYRKYPEILAVDSTGKLSKSYMGGSSATGGFGHGGVCLDSPLGKELAGNFLKKLVERYKDHPGMYGYDIWNECNYPHDICYCEHTQKQFREWLKKKYGTIKELNQTWHRYSYASFEDVMAPVETGMYPDCMDWQKFRKVNFHDQMQWRVDLIRGLDTKNKITAHGIAASLNNMAAGGSDDWLAASKVESYGMTWVTARKGSEPWKQWHAVDLLRASSHGKPFWHSEMQGGPLWLQPQVIGRKKEDGRVATAEDIRLWNMVSLAGGVTGILYLRWRSLLDGPLFGSFGLYSNNGLPNERSKMASKIAIWANDVNQKGLFQSSPVKGEIGIIVIPETQTFNYLMEQAGTGQFYANCMCGAYRGFFDNNVLVDWVNIDHISEYDTLYLPYPIHITSTHVKELLDWVSLGGKLIVEGCPAYFGDNGTVGIVQPNYGFQEACGAVEQSVEFMPDLGDKIVFDYEGKQIDGGLFLQAYKVKSGKEIGRYEDGRIAAVQNSFGKGQILLIGTYPSEGYYRNQTTDNRNFFASLLTWADKEQLVKVSNTKLQVRIRKCDEGTYLWAINPTNGEESAEIILSEVVTGIKTKLWGDNMPVFKNGSISICIPPKDAVIIQIY
ncbi:MAG TPA: alpha-amylase family protein [Clostridiaceae bacterium]